MNTRVTVLDKDYAVELRELREMAFSDFQSVSKMKKIGNFTVGKTVATWRLTEIGEPVGTVILKDAGPKFKGASIIRTFPTTLDIIDDDKDEYTKFFMDLDYRGIAEVYRNLLKDGSVKNIIANKVNMRRELKMGLAHPNEYDLDLLHEELMRGATGLYTTRQEEVLKIFE